MLFTLKLNKYYHTNGEGNIAQCGDVMFASKIVDKIVAARSSINQSLDGSIIYLFFTVTVAGRVVKGL